MKVYVLNHPEGKGLLRRKYMAESLSRENIEFEFVDGYHPNDFDYEKSIKNWNIVNTRLVNSHTGARFEPIYVESTNIGSYITFPTYIGKGSISLLLKHKHCWYDQIFNKYDYVVIFEDDCEIPNDLENILNDCIKEMEENQYDIVMLGGVPGMVSPNYVEGKRLHYDPRQKCRCTHGYILNLETSKVLLETSGIVNNAIDIKMSEIMHIFNLKVAWLEPSLMQIFEESLTEETGR
jgi:GR25 family glycosyltransferase involved in LPS biosynthesis